MSARPSRCQSAVGSRAGSRCPSARGSQTKLKVIKVTPRPQSACPPPAFGGPSCRPGCTVCCGAPRPPPCGPPCPIGIFVERTKSLKPAVEFVPSCAKMNGLSTYREFYYPKCGERAKSYKPATVIDPSCARMDGMTTYREFYYPKCGLRSQSFKPTAQVDPSCARMEGMTTYKNDFIGCQTERVKSLKPLTLFDPSCAKMDGLTTYRHNYIPYCPKEIGRPEGLRRTNELDFSCAPFEGMTTYKGDYWCKPIVRVESLKPTVRGAFSDAPFADRTTYRNDFHSFHFDRNCGGGGPCMPVTFGQEASPLLFCASGDTGPGDQAGKCGEGPREIEIGGGGDTGEGGNCCSDKTPPSCSATENRMEAEVA